jgi:hypothetical protein
LKGTTKIMSTDYSISGFIFVADLFGGGLDKYGITDAKSADADERQKCLTDGENNYLWVYGDPVECFTRYLPNGWPGFILQAIANEFEVEIFSEHDEETPSYVPLGKPTEREIAVMRAEWRTECEGLEQEMKNLRVTWRGKEITTAS